VALFYEAAATVAVVPVPVVPTTNAWYPAIQRVATKEGTKTRQPMNTTKVVYKLFSVIFYKTMIDPWGSYKYHPAGICCWEVVALMFGYGTLRMVFQYGAYDPFIIFKLI
jgi:hypothetical protein